MQSLSTAERLATADRVLEIVRAEIARATAKYPAFNSAHEGYGVLLEEVDELWDEVKADHRELACAEAVQVAAMAIRFITDLCDGTLPALMTKTVPALEPAAPLVVTASTTATFGMPGELMGQYSTWGGPLQHVEMFDNPDLYLDETILDYMRLHHTR